ncbi:pyridoxal phosphate-dependent decarboxylase family protein [Pseudoruegeria sp. SHC-113]|uniref:pyridoxal phosphate-dependent decarboxylase family protein n=1 Tax=Pseudoruegeria sp. SHC-113 TaxID=2855439 RepID=UPI0021BB0C1C|nr:pyridoxal-dependent decarboxylase [Pseudoruegeria sp. SHC-113]MCT8160944.1 cytochrome D ubiquinol oxidase subunit I [Pseudoruegeria sp. SHC-113]
MAEGRLDPKDWQGFRAQAHRMLDAALDKMEAAGDGPVWTPMPDDRKAALQGPLPHEGQGAAAVVDHLQALMPYGVGNTHPRFWGWVHGAGSPGNILPEMAAAAINANLGGRDHGGIYVERAVVRWCAQSMGLPESASGLIVSGTSMATIIALKCARDQALGAQVRREGVGAVRLVGYCSEQAHSCVARAFDMLGLGSDALRRIPVDAQFRMKPAALTDAIAADRAAGFAPFLVVGTAGAVNTGAIDPLSDLAGIAAQEGLWFHVDGAFGATARLSPALAPLLTGMEKADSLAFDFHKWLQVTYDAGCVLIRDPSTHLAAFSERPDYLAPATRGLAAGDVWPVDYGPELSRSYRALKVYAHLIEHGTDALGAVIAENCRQARLLEALVQAAPDLEALCPVALNILCFRFTGGPVAHYDALNAEVALRLQESGLAVLSTTKINGRLALRVNITNHRTRDSDLELLVTEVQKIGAALLQEGVDGQTP